VHRVRTARRDIRSRPAGPAFTSSASAALRCSIRRACLCAINTRRDRRARMGTLIPVAMRLGGLGPASPQRAPTHTA